MSLFISFFYPFIISIAITPIIKFFSRKLHILDYPGTRKIHQDPIPLLGGVAVFLAFAISLLFFRYLSKEIIGILLAGLIFISFGLLDDAGIKMRARYKIWTHLMFSLIFIYISGIRFTFFDQQWINILLTIGFIAFMTNSVNMLDGMDGLVSGISFFCACFFAILAYNSGQKDVIILSLALMGACLGFLKYNFNPASIFLGEAGSTFIGFMLAILAIRLNVLNLWNTNMLHSISEFKILSFIIPVIVLGVPIFDTYFVFINRFLNRIKFSQPGRDHSHHRILLMGFSQKITVLTLYAIQLILGSIAIAMIKADVQHLSSLLFVVFILVFGFTAFLLQSDVYSSVNSKSSRNAVKDLTRN